MERKQLEKLALKKCSAQNYDRLKECIDSMSDIMLFAIVRNKLQRYLRVTFAIEEGTGF